jgi:DNA-binding CsgD family transcriptional regulator/tetratricopeptide (TPR) repeat protein
VAARVTSTRFVGRQPELTELDDLLGRARDGRAWMAFVTGESGMGKTRLVDEFAARAREGGARVLSGECVELGESELAYAPIVSALRPLARNHDPVLDELGASGAVLAQLLPRFGEAGAAPVTRPSETSQGQLFEALLSLLDRLGEAQPVVLVVEDIHWADRSTRDFLIFLSRTLCRERVLVLATYRSDELHRRHPLLPVVAELERSDRAVRIGLQPFTRAELADQLEDILGTRPDEGLLDRLLARSEGNPLYVEELVAAGRDGRGEVPPTLRDALMLRVEALSEDAQELLRIVAAAQRLDHELLTQVSSMDPRALRSALREAVGQRLLTVDDDDQYAFRHALLREAVHDDLLPGEHAELHGQLAGALEQRIGVGDWCLEVQTEVAHHWIAAGDREKALRAAIVAADAAETVHANGEAAALLERALELWERVAEPEQLAGCDHVDLLRRAAQAHGRSADHPRMRTLLRHALEEIDREAEPRRAAAVLERLAKAEWELGRGAVSMETLDEALALLPAEPPPPERAVVLAAQGRGLMLAGRFDDGAARCRAAIDVARRTGTTAAEDSALNTLGVCLASRGDIDGGQAALRESMKLARADDRVDDLARAYTNLADVLFLGGRPEDARDLAREGIAELSDVTACSWLRLALAEIAQNLGDWDETERMLDPRSLPNTRGLTRVHELLRRAELTLGRGDHHAAITLLEEARDRAERTIEPQWHGPIAALLAQAYRRDRRYDDARAVVATAVDRISGGRTQDVIRIAWLAAAGVATEADRAEHARGLGRTEEADEAVGRARELLQVGRAVVATPRPDRPLAAAHVGDAEAEALRAEGRPDAEAYARAAAGWDALRFPYLAALARRRQAETLAVAGDREAAATAAGAARATAARIGAAWLVAELDLLARRARLRVVEGGPAAPAAPEEPAAEELGLTPREREVLALLAEGRTNREIGETLFMAEKTASVHVSRILAKLEVRTRTEAAAVAHRLGIAA